MAQLYEKNFWCECVQVLGEKTDILCESNTMELLRYYGHAAGVHTHGYLMERTSN